MKVTLECKETGTSISFKNCQVTSNTVIITTDKDLIGQMVQRETLELILQLFKNSEAKRG